MKKAIVILAVLLSAMMFTLEVSKVQANPIKLNRIEFVDSDMEVVYAHYFEVGSDLSDVVLPDAPEKEGYTFVGWSIELPDEMPDYNMVIHAQYMVTQVVVHKTIGA
ncbi:MAG: InlB B-repeat-containing protein [Acholeplasmataceae bacterium]|nr:InlB B-repeat-containing protein [Acholeplasmataceae bacterium]